MIRYIRLIDENIQPKETVAMLDPLYLLEFGVFGENASRSLFILSNINDYKGDSILITSKKINSPESLGLHLVASSKYLFIYR